MHVIDPILHVSRKIITSINNISLRNKMILAFFIVISVPFLLVGIVVIDAFRQMALDEAVLQCKQSVLRVRERSYSMIRSGTDVAHLLSLDEALSELALQQYPTVLSAVRAQREFSRFDFYKTLLPDIAHIRVYTPNTTILNNWELTPITEKIRNQPWYLQTQDHQDFVGWLYLPKEFRNENSNLCVSKYFTFAGADINGLLTVELNTNNLSNFLAKEPFDTIILSDEGIIIASNNKKLLGHNVYNFLDIAHVRNSSFSNMYLKSKDLRVFSDVISLDKSFSTLRVISAFSIREIMARPDTISLYGVLILFLCVSLALVLIFFLGSLITKRLLHLTKEIKAIAHGSFEEVIQVDGNDEIGDLASEFNHMVVEIRHLMNQIEDEQREKYRLEKMQDDMKLKMLTSQINPHFLYNSLESIRMKAILNSQKEIARTVQMLGTLLRKKLEITRDFISLREEIDIVQSYLEIQKFRHDGNLNYHISLCPEAEAIKVPPFIIQPLVENAVLHGLEPKIKDRFLEITLVLCDQKMRVNIRDNGLGMKAETLEKLQAALKGNESLGIGLQNVNERLKLVFGKDWGLNIQSQEGEGTLVFFYLPLEVPSV